MGNLKNALIAYKEDHQDITWADMADSIGISLGSLFNYINGRVKPRASTMATIAKVLELDVGALLETEEEPEEAGKDLIEPVPPKADKEKPEGEPKEKEKTTVHVTGNAKPKITVCDVCETVVSDLKITFDEDPNRGRIDVIIPVSAEPTKILGEGILDLEVCLMMAKGDAIIISTNSRR